MLKTNINIFLGLCDLVSYWKLDYNELGDWSSLPGWLYFYLPEAVFGQFLTPRAVMSFRGSREEYDE